jgi:hypothetical protein
VVLGSWLEIAVAVVHSIQDWHRLPYLLRHLFRQFVARAVAAGDLPITGAARQIFEALTHGADDSFLVADANGSFWRWSSKRRLQDAPQRIAALWPRSSNICIISKN